MPITSPDPRYVPLGPIQQVFFDKLYDEPMSAGVLTFFHDNQRTIPKNVYKLSGNPGSYQYVDIGNTITLSNIGAVNDSLGNNIQCFLFPYIEAGLPGAGNIDLYYIVCENSGNQFQFSSEAQPFLGESAAPESTFGLQNFIPNSQFLLGQNSGTITSTKTQIAYGGWEFIKSSNLCATDTIAFPRFSAPLNGVPSGNPRYACRISTTAPNAGDTYKTLQIVFQDVNRFSDPNQQLTLFFSGLNNQTGLLQLNVSLYKYFGAGGSTPTTTPIGSYAFSNTGYTDTVLPFFFGSNYGKTLGSGNDDYFAIQIELPPTLTFDISLTDFCLYLGNVDITAYPLTPDPVGPYINVQTFASSGTYTPSNGLSYATIECWGAGGGGGGTRGTVGNANTGGGGGAGGYSRKTVSSATIGASQTVTIGAGGIGVDGQDGTAGTDTSVGTICIAKGGSPGEYGVTTSLGDGGLGGVAGTGDIAAPGMNGAGGTGAGISYAIEFLSGWGGSTFIGSAGQQIAIGPSSTVNGRNATGYGCGGGGSVSNNIGTTGTGGSGSPGYVVITEFIGS